MTASATVKAEGSGASANKTPAVASAPPFVLSKVDTGAGESNVTKQMTKGLQNVWANARYSDFTIGCGERKWKAHKVVVCSQSDFFHKACDGEFKEAQTGVVTLKEDDPNVVEVMLHFMYHFDYEDEGHGGLAPLMLNAYLFVMADKYQVDGLKALAKDKFLKRTTSQWNTSSFAEVISVAYSLDDRVTGVLRQILAGTVRDHAKDLFRKQEFFEFREAALKHPQLLLDHSKSTAVNADEPNRNPANMDWYKCPGNYCKEYSAIFAISQHVPDTFRISCPLRCTYNKNKPFWDAYKI
ncbi:uncharacterized protein LTR77_004951 [Saxophila tyrrhenica]|uniref:BTB domain-containing protein n=1 Tax=Saxophila tyrrhenica TaxID=1690608 RepID=A0AAV9PAX2_9PEZI|nr:hypothetical protein LTR77_004951 [Saxophila tyrrhenica]